jgi:hypothetical protein
LALIASLKVESVRTTRLSSTGRSWLAERLRKQRSKISIILTKLKKQGAYMHSPKKNSTKKIRVPTKKTESQNSRVNKSESLVLLKADNCYIYGF